MTPETLLLIAQLATGEKEWQPVDADLCRMVVAYTESGTPISADKVVDGKTKLIWIVKAACIEDTVLNRLELIFGSQVGACEAGA